MTWEELLANSAALLNDATQETYTNTDLLPYLNMALMECEETFELNNIPSTNKTNSTPIAVDAGVTVIDFSTNPALPADLIEIQEVFASQRDQENWISVDKKEFLTPYQLANNIPVGYISVWSWQDQQLLILPCSIDMDIKLNYIKSLFVALTLSDLSDDITIINVSSMLQFRVAALAAEFIAENPGRAESLNVQAALAANRSLGISVKAKQSIVTRRRPFRAGWKRRGIIS